MISEPVIMGEAMSGEKEWAEGSRLATVDTLVTPSSKGTRQTGITN